MSTDPNPNEFKLSFVKMEHDSANQIVHWRYPPPYDIYNLDAGEETIRYVLDPINNFYAIKDQNHQVVGFCSFGQDAQVHGGDYSKDALDIGMGMCPYLTGQGFGTHFATAVMSHARGLYDTIQFRVTIAAFNKRAQSVWTRMGLHPIQHFTHQGSGRDFVVMVGGDQGRQGFSSDQV